MVLVIILYRRNDGADRHIAVFSAVFVLIQLLEFFAWLSLELKDRKLNDLITRLVLISLWAQPLINTYMARKNTKSVLLTIGLVVFTITFITAIATSSGKGRFETEKGPTCHLVWSRTKDGQKRRVGGGKFMSDFKGGGFIYLAGLLVPLLFIKPLSRGIKLGLVGLLTLFVARQTSTKSEYSSMWCFAAGIFTLTALIAKK